jgi:hypothetical protein
MGSSPRKCIFLLFRSQEDYWGRDSNEYVALTGLGTIQPHFSWRIQCFLKMYYSFRYVKSEGNFSVGIRQKWD